MPRSILNEEVSLFLQRQRWSASTSGQHERHLAWFLAYAVARTGTVEQEIRWDKFYEVRRGGVLHGWAPIDEVFLNEFLSDRYRHGCSPESYNRIIGTLRLFFRWLVRREVLTQDPTYHVEPARTVLRIHHHKFLTLAQCEGLLSEAMQGPLPQRDFPLVYTILATGARPAEAVNLRADNVDFTRGFVGLNSSKGPRRAALFPDLAELLEGYLKSHWYGQVRASGTDWLFPGNDLRSQLTNRALNRLLNQLAERAGIDKKITAYWLRHTYATQMYRKGAPYVYVSEGMGHRKLGTTRRYIHAREARLRELVNRAPTTELLVAFHRRMLSGG